MSQARHGNCQLRIPQEVVAGVHAAARATLVDVDLAATLADHLPVALTHMTSLATHFLDKNSFDKRALSGSQKPVVKRHRNQATASIT